MDPLLPYKVLRVPLALGVCAGMVGEVLHECESEAAARALLYDTWSEDRDTVKGIYYTYEVAEWRNEIGPAFRDAFFKSLQEQGVDISDLPNPMEPDE